jgi:hypothetical protein
MLIFHDALFRVGAQSEDQTQFGFLIFRIRCNAHLSEYRTGSNHLRLQIELTRDDQDRQCHGDLLDA